MAYHYIARAKVAPWAEASTWTAFWRKRFFRIAPLYYVLLLVALMMGPYLGHARDQIAAAFPGTATDPARYLDASLRNALVHITFLYGVLPEYSFRTPLPDWSIGLEMQFYLIFPFVMLLWRRLGPAAAMILLVILCETLHLVFPGYWHAFPMPSLIALKLHVFLSGSLLAGALLTPTSQRHWMILGALLLPLVVAALGFSGAVYAMVETLMTAGFTAIVFGQSLTRVPLLGTASSIALRVLNTRLLRWLGDTSYSVYLVHLLILLPVNGFLAGTSWYVEAAGPMRFLLSLAIAAPPVYLVSTVLFYTVEKPGIRLGRLFDGHRTV
jgi:peptidoglycan/LPS O-acetylase OafA/YrhL